VGKKINVAWAITGSGEFMPEVTSLLCRLPVGGIDLFLSRAGEEVVKMYEPTLLQRESIAHVFYDRGGAYPISGRFSVGYYHLLVVAPATSNTVAKMVYGIADTLVTTIFAQAGKARVPIVVLPSDVNEVMISNAPNGRKIVLYRREVDFRNVALLSKMEGVSVVNTVGALIEYISRFGLFLLK